MSDMTEIKHSTAHTHTHIYVEFSATNLNLSYKNLKPSRKERTGTLGTGVDFCKMSLDMEKIL